MPQPIVLWSAPRFRATCLAVSLLHGLRSLSVAAAVLDEPLHWRRLDQKDPPATPTARLATLDVLIAAAGSATVIIKMQAKHLLGSPSDVIPELAGAMAGARHVFLIRDPLAALSSHALALGAMTDIRSNLTFEGSGVGALYRVFECLRDRGTPFVVVDTDCIAEAPEAGMRRLSDALEVEYSPSMVSWSDVPLPSPPWGEHWYETLSQSRGWEPPTYISGPSRPKLSPLVDAVASLLAEMRKHALF